MGKVGGSRQPPYGPLSLFILYQSLGPRPTPIFISSKRFSAQGGPAGDGNNRTMKILKVYDEYIQFMKWRWKNDQICCILGAVQLVITCAALSQHIYSYVRYDQVLKCEFNSSIASFEPFLSSDIIIYDFGLFHRLWGIDKCIANHLDGGYMRFLWCINHVLGIVNMIVVALCVKEPKSFMLWPCLTIQSVYAIGLLILSISSLPKFLPSIFEKVGRESSFPMLIYMIGASMNFFLTYVLWHYYWHLEEKEKRAKLAAIV